jgi:hypothetical protein
VFPGRFPGSQEERVASESNLLDRARDELFSHINRCGVLQAAEKDQKQWMDETIDYIGERYPDLTESNLRDLYVVGLRFCKPVIVNGIASSDAASVATAPKSVASTSEEDPSESEGETTEAVETA